MSRVVLDLQEDERNGLINLALVELRDPREQLRMLLRQELTRRGMLKVDNGDSQMLDCAAQPYVGAAAGS